MSETESNWPDDLDAAERVRHVATTRTEPRNAGWIADEADVSRDTAVKYLTRMAERGELDVVETSDGDSYRPDDVTQFLDDVRRLAEEHTIDELTRELDAICEEIDSWKSEYDVESLGALRRSVGREDLAGDERRERLDVVEEWEYDREVREAIQLAIQLERSLAALDTGSRGSSTTHLQEG